MKTYVAPQTAVILIGVMHPVLGLVLGDGMPVVSSDGSTITYPEGPGGDFGEDEGVAVKNFNVWSEGWSD